MENTPRKPFIGLNHKKKEINLRIDPHDLSEDRMVWGKEARPIEVHLKEDGTIDDKPVICLVLSQEPEGIIIPKEPIIYAQISIEMFNEGLKDIGYRMVPIEVKIPEAFSKLYIKRFAHPSPTEIDIKELWARNKRQYYKWLEEKEKD